MKENELVMMRNKVESLTRVVDFMLKELDNTKTMSVGVYQLVKEMPGYEEAIALLSEKANEKPDEPEAVV
tara:strand:- start:894 stop:1103 length:210 start_codon:yes stop_codon:yes gene_type:complete